MVGWLASVDLGSIVPPASSTADQDKTDATPMIEARHRSVGRVGRSDLRSPMRGAPLASRS